MSDAAKTFIQSHRDAFDAALPGAHGWVALERMLDRIPSADGLERQLMCDRLLLDTAVPGATIWDRIQSELDQQTPSDSLEKFIQHHREDFDAATPDEKIWNQVAENISKPRAKVVSIGWRGPLLRMAASVALLIAGIGGGIWYERQNHLDNGMAMSEVSGEYAELEQYYQRDITVKKEKLATFAGNQPVEVAEDLELLDKIMEELRLELANVPAGNREKVVRAMIENYKAKTAILQRVLERLEESNTGGDNHKSSNGIKNI